jgi:hypothetical protein
LLHLAGRDKVGYYHELFLRSKRFLAQRIQRIKIKGEGARKPSSPETEPNFYNVPYLPSTRTPSSNPWIASVGNMGRLGPNMNVGTGGEVSLQERLLAFPAFPASFQQQQQAHLAPPPPLNNITRLQEFQTQLHLQQYNRTVPVYPDMQILASFQQQHIPMVSGHQDNSSNMAMALAMSRAVQDPAVSAVLPGFWRGALG